MTTHDALCVVAGGQVVALDLRTGAERWRRWIALPEHDVTPICGPGYALVQGRDTLHCFDVENGAERWCAAVESASRPHIVVVDDLVIVGSSGITRALRLVDGVRAWTAPLNGLHGGSVRVGKPAKPRS